MSEAQVASYGPKYPIAAVGDVVLIERGSNFYEAKVLAVTEGVAWSGDSSTKYYKLKRTSLWRPAEWLNETYVRAILQHKEQP